MAKIFSSMMLNCCICRVRTSINPHEPSSLEVTCEKCTNQRKRKFDQRNVAFLRLPFDNEHADGTSKGDVIIVVNGKTDEQLYVHKLILSNKSSVFSKMFDSKMLEDRTGIVRIEDTTLPIIRSVIKFCYDAEINFSDKVTSEDVLAVAHKYDIALLREICEDHLIPTLNNGNLPKRLKLARKFELTGLEAAAITHLKTNFDRLISAVLKEFS